MYTRDPVKWKPVRQFFDAAAVSERAQCSAVWLSERLLGRTYIRKFGGERKEGETSVTAAVSRARGSLPRPSFFLVVDRASSLVCSCDSADDRSLCCVCGIEERM